MSINFHRMQEVPDFSQPSNDARRAGYLIGGFIKKTLSREEEDELDQWLLSSEENMELFERLTSEESIDEHLSWYANYDTDQPLAIVKRRISFPSPGIAGKKWWRIGAAASVVLIVLAVYFLARQAGHRSPITPGISQVNKSIRIPSVILRLPGNRDVPLSKDTAIDERFIFKGGLLVCNERKTSDEELYAVIVPAGTVQSVRLSDGTELRVNAASTIHFPLSFAVDDRRIVVSGECFLEVAKDAKRPFIVSTSSVEVKAVGTSFNVYAYPDEDLHRITMREGIVIIQDSSHQQRLQSGQQLSIAGDTWTTNKGDDPAVAMAWMNNEFFFHDASIEDVMRAVEKWYGSKVIYRERVQAHFNARISRNEPLARFLSLLSKTREVRFRVEGDSIYVSR